jgi:hypothetical protein
MTPKIINQSTKRSPAKELRSHLAFVKDQLLASNRRLATIVDATDKANFAFEDRNERLVKEVEEAREGVAGWQSLPEAREALKRLLDRQRDAIGRMKQLHWVARRRATKLLKAAAERHDPPPPTGMLTLVLCDLPELDLLLKVRPKAGDQALRVYLRVLRAELAKAKGYEAHSMRDKVLCAFKQPDSAGAFCLALQDSLLTAEWPLPVLHSSYGEELFYTMTPEEAIFTQGGRKGTKPGKQQQMDAAVGGRSAMNLLSLMQQSSDQLQIPDQQPQQSSQQQQQQAGQRQRNPLGQGRAKNGSKGRVVAEGAYDLSGGVSVASPSPESTTPVRAVSGGTTRSGGAGSGSRRDMLAAAEAAALAAPPGPPRITEAGEAARQQAERAKFEAEVRYTTKRMAHNGLVQITIYKGPKARSVALTGLVESFADPISGRTLYDGALLQRLSMMAGCLFPGQVSVDEPVAKEVSSMLSRYGDPLVAELGSFTWSTTPPSKGADHMSILLPAQLRHRTFPPFDEATFDIEFPARSLLEADRDTIVRRGGTLHEGLALLAQVEQAIAKETRLDRAMNGYVLEWRTDPSHLHLYMEDRMESLRKATASLERERDVAAARVAAVLMALKRLKDRWENEIVPLAKRIPVHQEVIRELIQAKRDLRIELNHERRDYLDHIAAISDTLVSAINSKAMKKSIQELWLIVEYRLLTEGGYRV